jgi:hypothetical protein
MPSAATAVYIEGPLLEGTFYVLFHYMFRPNWPSSGDQNKKTKMAEQQNNTVTTQQRHTAKPHTKL